MDEFYRIKRLPPYVFADRQRSQDQGASPGRGHHRSRHGQPGPGHAQAHRRQAGRGGARIPGTTATRPRAGITRLRVAMANWYRDRYGVELDPETEAIATIGAKEGMAHLALAVLQPGDGGAGPEPDLSDPLLLGGDRGRRPALGAAGRRTDDFFARLAGDGAARLAEGQAADPVASRTIPTTHVRGPRLLREGRGLRARAPAHGRARLRLRRLHVRRLPAAVVPRGAGGQGRRRRDLLALEVVQHGRAGGWASSCGNARDGPRAGPDQVLPRLRRLPAHPDRRASWRSRATQDVREEIVELHRKRRDVLVNGLNKLGWNVPEAQGHHVRVGAHPRRVPQPWARSSSPSCSSRRPRWRSRPGIGFGEYGEGYVRFALVENEQRIRQALRGLKHPERAESPAGATAA